jgi:hypothetical protein
MRFAVQYLADTARGYQPSARHAMTGRVWVNIGKPVSRLVVAEHTLQRARIDFKNVPALFRIREIAS